jgi:2-methylcitrate dehydratase PrpD
VSTESVGTDAIISIVDHFLGSKFDELASEVGGATKKSILDVLGSGLAGTDAPGCRELVSQVLDWGGRQESTIIGDGRKVPAPLAALANGTMCRAVDFDDVFEPGTVHASASVVPAALAAAELAGGCNGKEFLTAIAVGIDVLCRLAAANRVPPGISGMNATFQCAYFACAGVAGRLLGLNRTQMIHAMGLAYTQTAGNSQNLLEGTLATRLNQGLAAQGGLNAAIFAWIGFTAAKDVLEGKFGYYPVYQRDEYDRHVLLNDLGRRYEGVNVTTKLYPCCMHTHAAIDAILSIRRESDITVDQIARIVVRVNQQGFNFVCFPVERTQRPETIPEAQFSLPYIVAVALIKGEVRLEDFTAVALRNRAVFDLASKVECEVDPEIEQQAGTKVTPAVIEVHMANGGQFRVRVNERKGSPANPVSFDEVIKKFRQCAAFSSNPLPQAAVEQLADRINQIEQLEDVSEIVKLLQPQEPEPKTVHAHFGGMD